MTSLQPEQVYDKQLPWEISYAVWSPKMDLLALVLANGGVALYRMSLERVWCLEPAEEAAKVTQVAWKPDGRVLAAGYSSGQLKHLDLETGETVCSEQLSSSICCMSWCEAEDSTSDNLQEEEEDDVLPELPEISSTYEPGQNAYRQSEDSHDTKSPKRLTVLALGSVSGEVSILLDGVLMFVQIACDSGWIPFSLTFSPSLAALLVVCSRETTDSDERCRFEVDTSVFSTWSEQLLLLLRPFQRLSSCQKYLDRTIDTIREAWESVLLKIDSKLEKFKESLPLDSNLVTEFFELLLTGVPSAEMEHFLLVELTEKGLRKLSYSVEHSHAGLCTLLRRHLHAVSLSLCRLLLEVQGLARLGSSGGDPSAPLHALDEALAEEAVRQAGALLLLTAALQRVIADSTRHLHALLDWLAATALRLSEEPVPAESAAAVSSPHHVLTIVQFLQQNLTGAGRVQLERVAAFLRPEDSASDCSPPPSLWAQQVLAEECEPWSRAVQSPAGVSLLRQRERLNSAIRAVFEPACKQGARVTRCGDSLVLPQGSLCTSMWLHDEFITAVSYDSVLTVTRFHTRRIQLPGVCVQLQRWRDRFLLALLEPVGGPGASAPPTLLLIDASEHEFEEDPVPLSGYVGSTMAVSGSRGLLATVFRGNRRVRVYDMAAE